MQTYEPMQDQQSRPSTPSSVPALLSRTVVVHSCPYFHTNLSPSCSIRATNHVQHTKKADVHHKMHHKHHLLPSYPNGNKVIMSHMYQKGSHILPHAAQQQVPMHVCRCRGADKAKKRDAGVQYTRGLKNTMGCLVTHADKCVPLHTHSLYQHGLKRGLLYANADNGSAALCTGIENAPWQNML